MTFNSFAQLAEKYKTTSEEPDEEREDTDDEKEKEDVAPVENVAAPVHQINNFGDIYAAFDPEHERYD